MSTRRRLNKSRMGRLGTSTDLMPSIMGAIDAIWEDSRASDSEDNDARSRSGTPKRSVQANNFANLSPNVQKILANVPDEELNRNFSSEESLGHFRRDHSRSYFARASQRTYHKSSESLDIISPNVQKMLSNLPDVELANSRKLTVKGEQGKSLRGSKSFCNARASFLEKSAKNKDFTVSCGDDLSAIDRSESVADNISSSNVSIDREELNDSFSSKPLGSYLHTSPSGIASRTPVGRKNLGKYLQVPSESSVGTNSTASSEVSRPVSMTSLGSCSSSSSGGGGPNQPSSAYLASAESLDSDPEPTGSQGSADSGIAEQLTMSPEQCVLQEVMDTEAVYVADLREVIEGYLMSWRSNPDSPLACYLEDLFSNLEEIYAFNKSFLEDLQSTHCNPTSTANAFLHHDAGFSVYTEYCTNYPRTMTVLTQLTGDEKMAALFRERQLALGHALPLGSYLLKPVQRILKYHLLLQRLSKQCEQQHKATVDLALATMTSVASHINTMKRKHEHAVRVQEIQSQLYGWTGPDLTALGELIAEGTFRVGGARDRRHVFLFDKVLLIAKSKQDGSLAYKAHITCSNLMLVEQVRGEPLSFHILPFDNPRQQCTLRARSPQHKREWTLQLKRVILENYSAVIPSHARQLVMQLGQNAPEEDEGGDKWSPVKQHSTPQYLERRSRVRKSRDFSSRRTASHDRSFVSLASWRRKSEPGIVNQYTSKTLPKRITKIKKAKDHSTAKFYTDLSDSENCDMIDESNDSLEMKYPDRCEDIQESQLEGDHQSHIASTTLEKVVSDLLMQNEEFHKLMSRQRRSARDSEPVPGIWSRQESEDPPSKADSLPRDFQLNDQLTIKDCKGEDAKQIARRDDSLSSVKQPDVELEDLQESDLSSQLNDNEHPDHRIYRKSAIRFSLVQRFRAIISEEQKRTAKMPTTHKQGSESMGAKIAHPDYADPQKLFRSSQAFSRSDLCITSKKELEDDDSTMGVRETLDMSINAKEVLNGGERARRDFERRSLEHIEETEKTSPSFFNSSQSDSYYERLMEKNLNEDYVNKNKAHEKYSSCKIDNNRENEKTERKCIKRPTKAPPPIPTKPTRLLPHGYLPESKENIECCYKSQIADDSSKKSFQKRNIFIHKALYEVSQENHNETLSTVQPVNSSKGWVKTIVGRFE